MSEDRISFDISKNSDFIASQQLPESIDSLVGGVKKDTQPVVLDTGVEILPPSRTESALKEVQEAEEKQRKLREQYEHDKSFFENNVLQKSRSIGEIQEDYIKVLHPYYREKFLDGLARYGTIPAALKYMKDMHGLKIRGDILQRISTLIPAFKQEMDDALNEYQATIQIELHRRAIEGVEKGVYYCGDKVGTERVYSDALLAKMADTHMTEYKEAKQKESSRGNTINVQIIKDFHNYKD